MRAVSQDEEEKTLMIERNDMLIEGTECQVINFIDITAFKRLEKEKEKHNLLKTLNTTVHHEMLAPLRTNIQICKKLLVIVSSNKQSKLIMLMLISS